MTQSKEKTMKLNSISIVNTATEKNAKDSVDVDQAYLKVNQVSFEQNFKALMGHYKGDESQRSAFRM